MCKRIMALLLSLLLLVPTSVWAMAEGYIDSSANVGDTLEEEIIIDTVYVSASGSDSGKGTSDSPFLTLNRAINAVSDNGTVIIQGTLTMASNFNFEKTGKTVTITGGVLDASSKNRVILHNNTIFDNITLTFANTTRFFANGYKLVMGENVTMTNATYSGSTDLWVYGGGQENTTVATTDVTLLGGVYSRVYGGSYGGTITGDTHLTVGGNVNPGLDTTSHSNICNFYGGGQNDAIGGDTYFTYGGNAKGSYIFGASENASALTNNYGKTATIGGTSYTSITGGSAYSIYGGSNNVNHAGDVELTITGGTFSQIFGGNQAASLTGNVLVKVLGSTVKRRIYGGCYNETSGISFSTSYYVTGTVDLVISGGANITFADSDSDRSIYAHSRHKTLSSSEVTSIIFADAAGYNSYNGKLKAQDFAMKIIMGSVSAADYIHYYTYTANDTTDVITQTCKYHTSLSATATLSADTSVPKVYTGEEIKAAKVTYSGWEWEPVGDIVYSNNINAGTASATISCGGASVTYNYTIEKAEKSAPEVARLPVTHETVKGKADGKIEGLTKSMEVSSDGMAYTPVTSFNNTYAAGTYYVRYSEKDNYKASPATSVRVEEGRYLSVSFKVDGETVATREVEWNATLTDIPEIPHKENHDQVAPYWDVTDFSEIQSDIEVNAVYTLNRFAVNFVDKDGKVFYTAYAGCGENVGEQDLANAEAKASVIYGYDFAGWDKSTENVVEDITVTAIYTRQTTTYNTVLNTVGGSVERKEIQFDQRFTVSDPEAMSFLVDGQVIGGKGEVTLYGCGTLTIVASETAAPEELSVAILKTVTDEKINGKNVYRVFVHAYNPTDAEITSLGVMFAPESAYTDDKGFTMEALDENAYITLSTEDETHDLLATFSGITSTKRVTRVVRAYATAGGSNVYSARVYSHTFN